MFRYFTLFLFLYSTFSYTQVIDIEHLRLDNDTTGFAGSIGANLQITKNINDIFLFGGTAYIQYNKNRHLVFFMNNTSLKLVNTEEIINKGTSHLRYNYAFSKQFIFEAFGQLQYNTISKIDKRNLVGAGMRFRLKEEEKYNMFLGTLMMYEYEKNSDPLDYHNDVRFSGYFTIRYLPTSNIILAGTTFYQPRIDKFYDYRIYSYNTMRIKLIEKLSLRIIFAISYDTYPVPGIPKTQYDLINGIVYSFD